MATPMSWAKYLPKLFYSQFFVKIPLPQSDFSGQTVIVTGSNTGLGLEAARHLVRLKAARVILAVRTVSKGEEAAADILKTTKATKNTVEVWPLDLSNYDSIKTFAGRVEQLERLDAVIQNAGIMTQKFGLINGEETHLVVNVIGAVLLGLLVLPKLRESAKKFGTKGRLSFVGSDLQYMGKFSEAKGAESLLDALNDKKKANIGNRYATSKLLLQYAIREIAAKSPVTPDSNVIVDAMTPGACKSNLFRDDVPKIVRAIADGIFAIVARSTEVGGGTLVNAIRPDLPVSAHGAFLMDCKIAENGPAIESSKGQELQKSFNQELFARLEKISPGVTKVLG